jgi:hypothetical protein
MVDRSEPLRIAIDPDYGLIVAAESLLARFLLHELKSSHGFNDLLALFDGPAKRGTAARGPRV